MAVLAGLQIMRVVAGLVAIIHILGYHDRRLILQRNRMRRMALRTLGSILAVMGNVSVRADLVSGRGLPVSRGFDDFFKRSMAAQAFGFVYLCFRLL